mgnify:CR=1 FL=1
MRDPYEVLGVPRSASAAAIKSAFRKAAKKHHPDANKGDPKSAERFSELNMANEILGDEDKRKQFDRGEIDADLEARAISPIETTAYLLRWRGELDAQPAAPVRGRARLGERRHLLDADHHRALVINLHHIADVKRALFARRVRDAIALAGGV